MKAGVFDSLRVGPANLSNRLALAPVKTALGGTDGLATERHLEYYRRRSAESVPVLLAGPEIVSTGEVITC